MSAKNVLIEKWKTVQFDIVDAKGSRYEISNFGRVRSFNKNANGRILKLNKSSGYDIITMRRFIARDEKTQNKFDFLVQQKFKLMRKLKSLKDSNENKMAIKQTEQLLESFRKDLSKKFKQDEKKRTISFRKLIHRLVAEYFLKPRKPDQIIVGHLDHNKINNRVDNLKWMTQMENATHQKSSPLVIQSKLNRINNPLPGKITNSKLTITKVMLLKKLLNQDKSMKSLIRQFKITHTQILRIKRGINWGSVEAAK